jgi:hypothetical protein
MDGNNAQLAAGYPVQSRWRFTSAGQFQQVWKAHRGIAPDSRRGWPIALIRAGNRQI